MWGFSFSIFKLGPNIVNLNKFLCDTATEGLETTLLTELDFDSILSVFGFTHFFSPT